MTVSTAAGTVVADVDGLHDVPGSGTPVGLELRRALVATPAGDVVAVVTGSVTPHA